MTPSIQMLVANAATAPASLLDRLDTKTLTQYGGAIVLGAALLLLLVGAAFGRRGLRGLGVVLWMAIITAAMMFSLFVMGDSAKAQSWNLPVLCAAIVCLAGAGEWALRKLRSEDP